MIGLGYNMETNRFEELYELVFTKEIEHKDLSEKINEIKERLDI